MTLADDLAEKVRLLIPTRSDSGLMGFVVLSREEYDEAEEALEQLVALAKHAKQSSAEQ